MHKIELRKKNKVVYCFAVVQPYDDVCRGFAVCFTRLCLVITGKFTPDSPISTGAFPTGLELTGSLTRDVVIVGLDYRHHHHFDVHIQHYSLFTHLIISGENPVRSPEQYEWAFFLPNDLVIGSKQ